jgi:hypothetical protein
LTFGLRAGIGSSHFGRGGATYLSVWYLLINDHLIFVSDRLQKLCSNTKIAVFKQKLVFLYFKHQLNLSNL